MWRLVIFLLFLVASVWFGLTVAQHPGYLLLVYQPWMVQMPLWFALLALLIAFGVFYLVVNGLDRIRFLWFRLKNWLRFRRQQRAYSKTQHGLAMLIEERWKKAERLLLSGVEKSMEPLMNYLGAAKAAHEQAAYERRDRYIQKAHVLAPDANIAISLTQAEMELAQGNTQRAIAILNHLRQASPRHPGVLKLLEKAYVHLADWENLQKLLPYLKKAHVINAEQFNQFEKNIYCERLHDAIYNSHQDFRDIWNNIPRHFRKNSDVVYAYVQCLLSDPNDEAYAEAAELVRKTLNTRWHEGLARLYGTLPLRNLNRQLVIVGAWLKMYGQQAALLLTLGRLCARIQLWGKAKDYFEKCLAIGPDAEASLEYGKLLEELDETQAALRQYQEGLKAAALSA